MSTGTETAVDYTAVARAVLESQNRLRDDPASFIPIIEEDLKYFDAAGKIIWKKGQSGLCTQEGKAAWEEAIKVLKELDAKYKADPSAKPPQLTWNDFLAKACADHCADVGPLGKTGHDGADGSTMNDRIERHGRWSNGSIGENISYGDTDGDCIVMDLFIDDGVPSRGHRTNLLAEGFKECGIAAGLHSRYGHMCVLDYAASCTALGELTAQEKAGRDKKAAKDKETSAEYLKAHDAKNTQNSASAAKSPVSKKTSGQKGTPDVYRKRGSVEKKVEEITGNMATLSTSSGGEGDDPAGYVSKETSVNMSMKMTSDGKTKTTTTTTTTMTTYGFKDGSTEVREAVEENVETVPV